MKFKNDGFRRSRGGNSRFLDILCSKCNKHIAYYQKDGPRILKRMYLDRIIGSDIIDKNLTCNKCNQVLGVRYIYEKEGRPAIRLFVGDLLK